MKGRERVCSLQLRWHRKNGTKVQEHAEMDISQYITERVKKKKSRSNIKSNSVRVSTDETHTTLFYRYLNASVKFLLKHCEYQAFDRSLWTPINYFRDIAINYLVFEWRTMNSSFVASTRRFTKIFLSTFFIQLMVFILLFYDCMKSCNVTGFMSTKRRVSSKGFFIQISFPSIVDPQSKFFRGKYHIKKICASFVWKKKIACVTLPVASP